MKRVAIVLVVLLVSLLAITILYRQVNTPLNGEVEPIYTGFYTERKDADYLVDISKKMASAIPDAAPCGMLVLRQIPPPSETDLNEIFLKAFDDNGIKVVLQVEPGYANISELIDSYLGRYGNHACVLGFGLDLEWRQRIGSIDKMIPVTDDEAEAWVNKTKSYNPNFKLFFTHFIIRYLPPIARQGIVFISDSQGFGHGGLTSMVNQFKHWGDNFSQTEVGFIIGYDTDRGWWSKLVDPVRDIGSALTKNISNCRYVIWYHPETTLTPSYPKYSQSPVYYQDKIECNLMVLFFKAEGYGRKIVET